MTIEELNYKLTGIENPRYLTSDQKLVIEHCLVIINEIEQNSHKHVVSGKLQDVIEDCLFDFKNEDKPLSVCVALILAACATSEGGQTGE